MLNKNFLPKKLNKKAENLNLLWVVLFFLGVVAIIYFSNQKSLGKIKEKHIYTIGTVRDYAPSRTGKSLIYTYMFKGTAYTGGYTFYGQNEKFSIGNRFLVILSPDDPDIAFFIPYQIPHDINAPNNGWEKPPLNITEMDVMRYLEEKY